MQAAFFIVKIACFGYCHNSLLLQAWQAVASST
jgi:hypothetical protein